VKYRTRFVVSAQAELRRVPRGTALTILRKLAELESDPRGFGTTELVGDRGVRRLRVGDYHVFYEIHDDELIVLVVIVLVVKVGHRSTVYPTP
jgi:mRNA interferase RelE/StbE